MARKTAIWQVPSTPATKRDEGKMFLLTEMSAADSEAWAVQAFMLMSASATDIPEEVSEMGMFGLLALGLNALKGINYNDLKPLLDTLFQCVQIIPDPAKPHMVRPPTLDDIEEPATRLLLRKEVWALHTDFLSAAGIPITASAPTATEN